LARLNSVRPQWIQQDEKTFPAMVNSGYRGSSVVAPPPSGVQVEVMAKSVLRGRRSWDGVILVSMSWHPVRMDTAIAHSLETSPIRSVQNILFVKFPHIPGVSDKFGRSWITAQHFRTYLAEIKWSPVPKWTRPHYR
jgi:hypothetical protein